MALGLQRCGSRSGQDELEAKKLIKMVENDDSDARLIREVYQKRFAPDGLPAIYEIATQLQDFSKSLVNHKADNGKTLMRRAIIEWKQNPNMQKAIDFLINNGAKMFLDDLRLAAELDDKACSQKISQICFDSAERLLEDSVTLCTFIDPVVLDCGHTVDKNTFEHLKETHEEEEYDYGRDEHSGIRLYTRYTVQSNHCPLCKEKFTKGVPSVFTKQICELSEAQDEEDMPQKFIDFIDMAKGSRLEGVLAKEVIRKELLEIVLHEGWAKARA